MIICGINVVIVETLCYLLLFIMHVGIILDRVIEERTFCLKLTFSSMVFSPVEPIALCDQYGLKQL